MLRHDADNQLRTAAYEVLNTFVMNSAGDGFPIVAKLSDVILQRLEGTIPMQSQIVSVEDRITLEEMQTSLTSVLLVSVVAMVSLNIPNDLLGYHSAIRVGNKAPGRSLNAHPSPIATDCTC